MGLDEDIWRRRGCQSNRLRGLHKLRVELLRDAFNLDLAVYDLDEDAVEDRPVEQLAQARIGLLVGLARLAEQQKRVVQSLHDVVDLGDGLVLPALDLGLLVGDALLLCLHDLDGDGVAVVELDEFLLLSCQLPESAAVAFCFGFRRGGFGGDELAHGGAEGLLLFVGQPRPVVEIGDHLLHSLNRRVWIAAGTGRSNTAQTGVVVVVAAELAAVAAIAKAGTADPAEDGAVEVVAVLLGAFPACPMGIKHGLDALEAVTVDDRLMPPWPLDAVPGYEPGVVVVAQDAVDGGAGHWPGWPGWCWPCP